MDLHHGRSERGELSGPTIAELWIKANRQMFGDVVEMTEGYGCWWSYIGHFVRSPFYCYAYAFGELLVLALYQKYRQDGAAFVPRYLDLLAAGGSAAPDVLLQEPVSMSMIRVFGSLDCSFWAIWWARRAAGGDSLSLGCWQTAHDAIVLNPQGSYKRSAHLRECRRCFAD